jgi:hypothetical protein
LFKLLERYVCSWRLRVKVEPRLVLGIAVLRRRKLLLAMVADITSLGINSVIVLPQHFDQFARPYCPVNGLTTDVINEDAVV